jgi:ketosteroid isomerase-like protein
MSDSRVQLVRQAVDAWNRRDTDWLIANCVPEVEFVPAVAGGVEGRGRRTVRGADGFDPFFAGLNETWEQFEIELDEVREVGEALVNIGRVHAKGRGSGLVLDQPMATVTWFRGDKFARLESFLDIDEALEAAKQRVAA